LLLLSRLTDSFSSAFVASRMALYKSDYYYFWTLSINDPEGGKIKLIKNENSKQQSAQFGVKSRRNRLSFFGELEPPYNKI